MKSLLIAAIAFFTSLSAVIADDEMPELITQGSLVVNGKQEAVTLIRPRHRSPGAKVPLLVAPGSRNYSDPTFFWGDAPTDLGWAIVQTEKLYRGTPEELMAVINAVKTRLRLESIEIDDIHLIGWSANSGAAARHAAALGPDITSVSFIPGYGTGRTVDDICAHKNLRVNFITGSRDRPWLRGAERMRDQLERCGMPNVSFTIIEDGGHVLREISGEPLFRILNSARSTR